MTVNQKYEWVICCYCWCYSDRLAERRNSTIAISSNLNRLTRLNHLDSASARQDVCFSVSCILHLTSCICCFDVLRLKWVELNVVWCSSCIWIEDSFERNEERIACSPIKHSKCTNWTWCANEFAHLWCFSCSAPSLFKAAMCSRHSIALDQWTSRSSCMRSEWCVLLCKCDAYDVFNAYDACDGCLWRTLVTLVTLVISWFSFSCLALVLVTLKRKIPLFKTSPHYQYALRSCAYLLACLWFLPFVQLAIHSCAHFYLCCSFCFQSCIQTQTLFLEPVESTDSDDSVAFNVSHAPHVSRDSCVSFRAPLSSRVSCSRGRRAKSASECDIQVPFLP